MDSKPLSHAKVIHTYKGLAAEKSSISPPGKLKADGCGL